MSATDRAYAFAKERILDGRFPGGDLITEADVAGPAGMSRTPVREAFLRLESEGLLRLYPKRGALVVPVSLAEVRAVMEARLLIERFAIATVIERRVDLQCLLSTALAEQESLALPERAGEFVEADREFHRVFVAGVGNPILLQWYDSVRVRQSRMNLVMHARDAGRSAQLLREHQAIAAAVVDGRGGAADDLLVAHLRATLALLQDAPM